MREPVSAVACDDVNVLLALGFADEGHEVDRLEDLSAPFLVNCRRLRKATAGSRFEFAEGSERIASADFVVAATDD